MIDGSEKQVLKKTYTTRELDTLVERKPIVTILDNDPRIIKRNKIAKITDMIFYLNELDNSNNLEDGRPSTILFTYHVNADEAFKHLEPKNPQYKKLKDGNLTSLNLKITDENNNIITDGPATTVVLHVK